MNQSTTTMLIQFLESIIAARSRCSATILLSRTGLGLALSMMTGNKRSYVQGLTALKNAEDWTKKMRDTVIVRANEMAGRTTADDEEEEEEETDEEAEPPSTTPSLAHRTNQPLAH